MSNFKFEAWPTEFRSINQAFGANPQNYSKFGLPGHEGLDIMAPTGSKIFSVAPGIVRVVETNPTRNPYGIHVRVEHSDGYETIYGHLQEARVRAGQQVRAGELLGLADDTGNSFGSHLHLTLKHKGENFGNYPSNIIDPTPFILPLLGFQRPAGPYTNGWAFTAGITSSGDLAQANAGGINLRNGPSRTAGSIDLVPEATIMIITGGPQGEYTPVQVPTAVLKSAPPPAPPQTPTEPPPTKGEPAVNGWGFKDYLTLIEGGKKAIVGQYGINMRVRPDRNALNMGIVAGGNTVLVTGAAQGEYLPVRARQKDFTGPTNFPPETIGSMSLQFVSRDKVVAWAFTKNLKIDGKRATSGQYGTTLRSRPFRNAPPVGVFNEGAVAEIVGMTKFEYTPVWVNLEDVSNLVRPLPAIEPPTGMPEDTSQAPVGSNMPYHEDMPGWAFTGQITITDGKATAGQYGINLRKDPRRDGENLGFVEAGTQMIITGAPQGEYTPVRVDQRMVKSPVAPASVTVPAGTVEGVGTPPTVTIPAEAVAPEPPPVGSARIGLHASADPGISQAEINEFREMRPSIIKVLSFHDPDAVRQLVQNHPGVSWVVRAFLDFGGRNIRPQQFLDDTLGDVRRTLDILHGKDVVVELHNETNLTPEGLGSSWADGASFSRWWLELLQLYRQKLPGVRFIYPGLSPGEAVAGLKQDHVQFLEASRAAVEAADGLGVHIYWSNVYPMQRSLAVLDDYIARFRYKPIWVTEASNNKSGVSPTQKGEEYLRFWQELQKRPTVQGVTYFVASASNPEFKEEVWVGRSIGKVVGSR